MKYLDLVHVYTRLEATTKRLEKTHILSDFLKTTIDEKVLLLVQGRVFPNWDQRELGVAAKLLLKAISVASGASVEKIEQVWRETGDLGETASKLLGKKSQVTLFSEDLSCAKVFENLRKIAELEGEGVVDRKTQLIAELFASARGEEAKYIVRTVLQEMRIGLGEGTLRDSIVWAFFGAESGAKYDKEKNEFTVEQQEKYDQEAQLVQDALDMLNDFVEVALLARKGRAALENISLVPLRPVKVMLYQKAKSVADGFEMVGKPAAVEFKYDGFRLQIHKKGQRIILYTRRLEDVTAQFPDVIDVIKKRVRGESFILDAEAVGIDKSSGKYRPFQDISQRIRRKYDIVELSEKFPVEVVIFDGLFVDRSLLQTPFLERRKILEGMIEQVPGVLRLAQEFLCAELQEAEDFYKESLAKGNEGIMMKNLQAIYKPGSRVGFGVKVKPTMDTLEVVIVGAEYGEGKRGQWLASFIVAVRDPATNQFVELGRVGTGIKEKPEEGVSFGQLTELLRPSIIEEKGREVRVHPKIVIEVEYEEIQASPTYSSGFALRFPRFVRLREDRAPSDVNSVDDVRRLAEGQRGRDQ